LDQLSVGGLVYFVVVMILSFSVRGSAGFGGLNAPLLLIVLPAKVIVPALVMLGVLSSLAIVMRDHRYIQWRHVARTLPYGLIGVVLGVMVFKELDAKAIEKGLGLFILGYGLYSQWRVSRPPGPSRVPPVSSAPCSAHWPACSWRCISTSSTCRSTSFGRRWRPRSS
jgi:uncharacterized membrane protein YfcA